jgi:uncharacterized repeat protein (TIGR01451 family)
MRRPPAKLALAALSAALVLGITGASAVTTTQHSSGNMAAAIPDAAGLLTPAIAVPANSGSVTDVDVSVRLAHPNVGDLVVRVHHGTETVTVFQNRGGTGDDFGTAPDDCSGVFTIFDDAEANPQIGLATAPFTGRYRPDNALSAFNGMPAAGDWTLEVQDTAGNALTGTLFCWKLDITTAQSDLAVELTDDPDPVAVGQELTYTAKVTNKGPDAADGVELELDLPAGASVVEKPDTCTGIDPLTCDLGTVAKDAVVETKVVVTLANAGEATATATASPDSVNPSDGTASTTTGVDGPSGGGGSELIVVTLQGDGEGTVTSAPAGIDCGTDCIGGFAAGAEVTLTATPADGSKLSKWGGVCSTSTGNTCVVEAGGELAVSATFAKVDTGGGGNGGGSGGGVWYDICTIVGTNGPDVLRGTTGPDVICGLAGNDKIYGLAGNDRLYGQSGKDKLFGGSGKDWFYTSDGKADTVDGGSGKDKARSDGKDTLKRIEGVLP